MATGELEDWEMCPASLEEHVPTPMRSFLSWPLFSLLFSRGFDPETSGRRQQVRQGKYWLQNALFKAHVYMHLKDPSFAVWKMSIWYYANAFSWISQTFMDCDALQNVNFMCFDTMLNSQWCGASLFAWMPVTENCALSCSMRAENGCRLSHFLFDQTRKLLSNQAHSFWQK